jgi:hypothetical protein
LEKREERTGLGSETLEDGGGCGAAEGRLLLTGQLQLMFGLAVVGKGLTEAEGQLAREAHEDHLGRRLHMLLLICKE